MLSIRYKVVSDSRFDIVGKDEMRFATVERGDDGLWRVLAQSGEELDGLNSGPFDTSEEAFVELGAVPADQS